MVIFTYSILELFVIFMTKAGKRIVRTNVNNGKCDNMGNTNKTVTHIPYTQGWSIFVFISYPLLIKSFPDLQQILEIKKTLFWLKNQNAKNWKITYQQRGFKLKCSIDKNAILHKRVFSVNLSNKILLLESIFTYFQ